MVHQILWFKNLEEKQHKSLPKSQRHKFKIKNEKPLKNLRAMPEIDPVFATMLNDVEGTESQIKRTF